MSEEKMYEFEVELTEEEFLVIAKAAHRLDITINQFVQRALQSYIEQKDIEKSA